ncbi:MAG TPA: hypothetical protein VF795_13160 [Desulfuromonadaceae bacterium]
MKLPESFDTMAFACAGLLVIAGVAGALMWFGFFCGCRYGEVKTMASVYKAQLERTQELLHSDIAIANGYKEGQPKSRR